MALADEDEPPVGTEENGEPEENGDLEEDGEPEDDVVFSDIDTDDWFYDAVMFGFDNDLVIGFDDGTFKPANNLSRAQFVLILYRQAGLPDVADLENPFEDVSDTHWAIDAIKWAADLDVVEGYEDGTFRPGSPVTKYTASAIISRRQISMDLIPDPIEDLEIEWPDFDGMPDWAQEHVATLTVQGIYLDIPGESFDGANPASRAMAASMLYRWLTALEEAGDTEAPPETDGD